MDRLSADDRLILWPDPVWPQDVGALALLEGEALLRPDGSFRIEAARRAVEGRLHLAPRFRQVLRTPGPGLGPPVWVDDPEFDIRHHVYEARVPAPGGGEARLLRAVERIRRRRLDPTRPLWEMWFLTGLLDARIGLFIRLHHVMADGIAGIASLSAFLDETPGAASAVPPAWKPSPAPSPRDLFSDNVRRHGQELRRSLTVLGTPARVAARLRAAWPAIRQLVASAPGPQTSLNRVVGPDRRLALLRSSLDLVLDTAHANGATVNDVLLTVTAGGVRGLLQSRGEPVHDLTLPIYVPVSLRHGGTRGAQGNLFSQMVVHLPVGVDDPALRLRRIAAESAHRKAQVHPALGTMARRWLLSPAIVRFIADRRVNLTTADLPGPAAPVYVAGAKVLEVFPLMNLLGNVSLGVAAISYAGQFNAMVVADGDAYPDLDAFTAAAQAELGALTRAAAAPRAMAHV